MESLVNAGEYLSAHYLAEVFPKELRANQAKEWAKREPPTPRSRLRGLRSEFFAARAALAHDADKRNRAGPDADPAWRKNLTALHDKVLYGFGFDAVRDPITVVRAGIEYEIPVAHHEDGIVAIECGWATDVDAALDSTGAGQLAEPVPADSGKILRTGAELVGFLFGADDPPRYALILVGGVVILADRTAWHEGRYLAVNLDTALGRNDTAVAGELDIIAALFHAESLRTPPSGGETALAGVLDASTKHAVGVSSELRHGLRRSVELIANEVLARLRDAGCGVASIPSPRDFAKTLTLESLRYLYRIVFLLYAEARPELGILPVDHPEYVDGYGLGRLGELVTPRHIDEAASAGFHLYESLDMLFGLVNTGYRPVGEDPTPEVTSAKRSEGEGLRFEAMRSDLFSPQKITLIGRDTVNPADPGGPRIDTRLRNETLYQVLRLLMLTRGRKSDKKDGSGRAKVKERGGFISYAQLGINQLGAVYEGLMSYTGSIAHEDLYEVAKHGDPSGGSWVIPVRDADKYPDDEDNSVFVKREDEDTGQKTRVKYETGQFVYRLSGRARQVSASYYTPESLTKVTVQLTLEQRIKENGEHTAARELLDWRICEPALGSGAFLNEAINQVAAEYLRRRQAELGELIPPEDYDTELRKVKAYLALHNSYGVDLNGTAVELAEVSLWLNVMHPGLKAPWFGLHLRRGNSLIGAARRYYTAEQVNDAGWRRAKDTLAPTDLPFKDGGLPEGGVYHFLLPSPGWAAVADEKEAKRLAPEAAKALSDWRKAMLRKPKAGQVRRLQELSRSVESLWRLVVRRLELSEREISRRIDVWGTEDLREPVENIDRTDVLVGLRHDGSPYWRLKTLMDAWCAFWFWPVTKQAPEVSLDAWLDFAEALVGKVSDGGLISEPTTLAEMDDLEDGMVGLLAMDTTASLPKRFGWFRTARAIAEEQGFFHWELDFAHVFASEAAGFDLQVGNPPWVRPTWDEWAILAEWDPWFALTVKPPADLWQVRKAGIISTENDRIALLDAAAFHAGQSNAIGSEVIYPLIAGTQPDMYRGFMCRVWDHLGYRGTAGMLHPDTHLQGAREWRLREAAYEHLRIHGHFVNAANWAFAEPSDQTEFGLHIYGNVQAINFLHLSRLHGAEVLPESLVHDGTGELPGQKFRGRWDVRPHRSRVIKVTESLLANWQRLEGQVSAPARQSSLLYPITDGERAAISALADASFRVGKCDARISSGYHETTVRTSGLIKWKPGVPRVWDEVVLQGSHLGVGTPVAKQPNDPFKHNQDWVTLNLVNLPFDALPRTLYARASSREQFFSEQTIWNGRRYTEYYRLAWRAMVDLNSTERSLFAALIPPGPSYGHTIHSLALSGNRATALLAGFWSALPLDYLLRIAGRSHLQIGEANKMPAPEPNHLLSSALLLRSLRLNCLTDAYAPLWDELYEPTWSGAEGWAVDWPGLDPLESVRSTWDYKTPLRTELGRRAALVELDALVSVWLGIGDEDLVAIYRSRYPVLSDREDQMYFDAAGRRLTRDGRAFGHGQTKEDYAALMAHLEEGAPPPAGYQPPFYKADRVREMREAHAFFSRRLAEAQ